MYLSDRFPLIPSLSTGRTEASENFEAGCELFFGSELLTEFFCWFSFGSNKSGDSFLVGTLTVRPAGNSDSVFLLTNRETRTAAKIKMATAPEYFNGLLYRT